MHRLQSLAQTLLLLATAAAFVAPAEATPITLGDWVQFSFADAGTPTTGCDPADPNGGFCFPSSGTPTVPGGAPPWTFNVPVHGAVLTVTDMFLSGDAFDVFDLGTALGSTAISLLSVDCGDDPAVCLATPGMSTRSFVLAPGDHSLTITTSQSLGGGSAAFQVAEIPEPSTIGLITAGFGALAMANIRRKRRAQ